MLEGIDSTKVFEYFEQISRIPRGSGNNTAISNYLVEFAKEHKLEYKQDSCENVIIWKKASKGQEDKPVVILQGHMDMVCEKEAGCDHDFTKEPLDLQMDGDFIYAKGTTLGGDDGIAIAYALAILADETIVHPALEVVITTDEETGMDGAIGLDTSVLKGSYLLNLDSEEEGTILTSCAGGMTVNGTFAWRKVEREGYPVTIQISGLKGGHSGTEIDKNRENAVMVLTRVLREMHANNIAFYLSAVDGGLKDNAIPRDAKSVILVKEKNGLESVLNQIVEKLKKEMENSEPEISVSYSVADRTKMHIIDKELTERMLFFFEQVPNGVQKMSAAIPGLVESSLNLGICKTTEEGLFVSFSVRSSVQSYKEYIGLRLKDLIYFLGGTFAKKSEYPAWEYRSESKLREIAVAVYEEQYKKSPVIEAIHAGLECGILAGKMPDLDIVSIGPDIFDIHTPKERLSISSTKRVYQFVLAVLEKICD